MLGFVAVAGLEALGAPGVGEALSGIFGSVSLTAWICLLLPQLITNYKAKSADALSMKFLLIWLLGDIANLSGALFTSLAPSTIALAVYFCFADMILIAQCTYYNTINARRRAAPYHQHHNHHNHHNRKPHPSATEDDLEASTSSAVIDASSPAPAATEFDPLLPNITRADSAGGAGGENLPGSHRRRHSVRSQQRRGSTGGNSAPVDAPDSHPWLHNAISLVAVWVVGAAGWFVSYKMGAWGVDDGNGVTVPGIGEGGEVKEPAKMAGMMLGYASAVLYLCARIPQIIKNYREKSCEGLALLFFLLSLTGNFTYGASVIAYSQERDYFVRALPWLLGSLGTMLEDCVIFVQFRIYSPKRQAKTGGAA